MKKNEKERARQIREFVRNYANEPLIMAPMPGAETIVIKRIDNTEKPPALSAQEFNRLYRFFYETFERECPGHSEQFAHAYARGEIDFIKAARAVKVLRDKRNDESLTNWGGW